MNVSQEQGALGAFPYQTVTSGRGGTRLTVSETQHAVVAWARSETQARAQRAYVPIRRTDRQALA